MQLELRGRRERKVQLALKVLKVHRDLKDQLVPKVLLDLKVS